MIPLVNLDVDPVIVGIPDERGLPYKDFEALMKEVDAKMANRKRGLRIGRQVKQNTLLREACLDWMHKRPIPLTDEETGHFLDFTRKTSLCCHHSLFREHHDGSREYIGSHRCRHKLCAVCNAERSKKTRRIWRSFFEQNPELIDQYDFMHLTLTVPHTEEGWQGKRWYGQELLEQFNWLRKKKGWKRRVYAGEFGLEVTRNLNGFHIHIHALLLVYKGPKNRNDLHRFILRAWNRQTAGSSDRKTFSPEEIAAILKGNSLLTEADVSALDPSGATFIGLESLYTRSKEKKRGYQWCERLGAYKRYVRPSDPQGVFLAGIMECIKYHFEPMALKDNGLYDFELLREILPAIKGKRLYGKFGAFHARAKNAHPDAHMLSLSYKSEAEENLADLEDTGRDQVVHPETGEPVSNADFRYFLVSMAKVFFDPDDEYRIKLSPKARPVYLHVRSCREALSVMEEMGGKSTSAKQVLARSKLHPNQQSISFKTSKIFQPCFN